MDKGLQLLQLIRKRRRFEVRTLNSYIPADKLIHGLLSDEMEILQKEIGAKNKTIIRKECKRRNIPYPNFKNESL